MVESVLSFPFLCFDSQIGTLSSPNDQQRWHSVTADGSKLHIEWHYLPRHKKQVVYVGPN